MSCLAHLGEVYEHYDEILQLDAELLVVTFSPPERIPQYVDAHGWRFPVVADPGFEAYRAFDLPRGSWWQVAGPTAILGYLKLMLGGRLPHMHTKGDDVKQLGGDFVLDASGRLVYLYRSRESTDRPSVKDLLLAVSETASDTDHRTRPV